MLGVRASAPISAASTGLSVGAAASARSSAAATSSPPALTGGTKRTITASTRLSASRIGSTRSKVSGVAPPSMSTGFATLASAARISRNAVSVSGDSDGSSRPPASHASAHRMPSPPAFVSRPDAAPARQRLRREQRCDVEQFLERLGADHAGLMEQRVDGGVRAGERGGVRACGATARVRRSALQREDRLAPRDTPREPRELARVAERLEVEEHDVGGVVVLPPLQQVVGRDVRLVADRHERRKTEVAAGRRLEQREPERAALRREADVAGRNRLRRERGVQPRGVRRDPEAVRPEQARAVGAHEREQLLLALHGPPRRARQSRPR